VKLLLDTNLSPELEGGVGAAAFPDA